MTPSSRWAKVLLVVALIGAINWGLIGFFNWNLVDAVFGGGAHEETSGVSRFIYAIVGLCGLGALFGLLGSRGERLPHRRPLTTP